MANTIEVWDGTQYVALGEGSPGPTVFARTHFEELTPRGQGDLWVDGSKHVIDWSSGWVYPTLTNSWVNYNTGTHAGARYRKSMGNVVCVEGLVKGGTMNQGVFTLPAGFRPAFRMLTATLSVDNAQLQRLDVLADGRIVPVSGSNAWVSINAVFFADDA